MLNLLHQWRKVMAFKWCGHNPILTKFLWKESLIYATFYLFCTISSFWPRERSRGPLSLKIVLLFVVLLLGTFQVHGKRFMEMYENESIHNSWNSMKRVIILGNVWNVSQFMEKYETIHNSWESMKTIHDVFKLAVKHSNWFRVSLWCQIQLQRSKVLP